MTVMGDIRRKLHAARGSLAAEHCDEQAWRTFQGLVTGPLWEAVEDLEKDPYRRQLADVLDAAVTQLRAFQVNAKRLAAIDCTLEKLAARQLAEQDVDACENAWEASGVPRRCIRTMANLER